MALGVLALIVVLSVMMVSQKAIRERMLGAYRNWNRYRWWQLNDWQTVLSKVTPKSADHCRRAYISGQGMPVVWSKRARRTECAHRPGREQ